MIVGRNAEKRAGLVSAMGGSARFHKADVTREAEIAAAVDATAQAFGRLDILFNNAGGIALGGVLDFTEAQLTSAMSLLLGSVVFGVKHAAPIMKTQGRGSIINNSSAAAFRTHMGGYLYSIAKAGVTQATRLAGMELGRHGVTVNCVSPGGVATPIFFGGSSRAAGMANDKVEATMAKLERNLARATPIQRSGVPRDVAAAVLFLASDEGRYVNCNDLVVDSGMTAAGRRNFEPEGAP